MLFFASPTLEQILRKRLRVLEYDVITAARLWNSFLLVPVWPMTKMFANDFHNFSVLDAALQSASSAKVSTSSENSRFDVDGEWISEDAICSFPNELWVGWYGSWLPFETRARLLNREARNKRKGRTMRGGVRGLWLYAINHVYRTASLLTRFRKNKHRSHVRRGISLTSGAEARPSVSTHTPKQPRRNNRNNRKVRGSFDLPSFGVILRL